MYGGDPVIYGGFIKHSPDLPCLTEMISCSFNLLVAVLPSLHLEVPKTTKNFITTIRQQFII